MKLHRRIFAAILAMLTMVSAIHSVAHIHTTGTECLVCAALPGGRRGESGPVSTIDPGQAQVRLDLKLASVHARQVLVSEKVSRQRAALSGTFENRSSDIPDVPASHWTLPGQTLAPRAPPIS